MPDDGSKLRDVELLAKEGAVAELAVPVANLSRLAGQLASPEGIAEGQIEFGREGGFAAARVKATATLAFTCQRCLQPVRLPVAAESQVLFLGSEADAGKAPPDFETVLAPEGRLRLADLVEEELLLALPLAPRHEGECAAPGGSAERPVASAPPADVQRPFANLGALLGKAPTEEPARRGKRRR